MHDWRAVQLYFDRQSRATVCDSMGEYYFATLFRLVRSAHMCPLISAREWRYSQSGQTQTVIMPSVYWARQAVSLGAKVARHAHELGLQKVQMIDTTT